MADKMQDAIRHTDAVTATFEDAQGFTATVTISREDIAKLVRTMEGTKLLSRFSTFMEPETELVTAAGAYLLKFGYGRTAVIELEGWTRIWTAEAHGWNRADEPPTMQELIAAVKKHAGQHYEDPGQAWDVVIECWDTADFAATILDATTVEEAIKRTSQRLKMFGSHRDDIQATAF